MEAIDAEKKKSQNTIREIITDPAKKPERSFFISSKKSNNHKSSYNSNPLVMLPILKLSSNKPTTVTSRKKGMV